MVLLCLPPAQAQLPIAPDATVCAQAAAAAERKWDLPPDLLGAIGVVESGRRDPLTGQVAPWPWTINADGADHIFDTRAEAADATRTLLAHGAKFVDVGCFQIDLFYHPAAFASIEQGFDAVANADYAARFLTDLRARTGSWEGAIAAYHSLGDAGDAYRRKVIARWGTPNSPSRVIAPSPAADPFVVVMSASARGIKVFRP